MKIHIFQHVAFEGPTNIEQWAIERGHSLSFSRFYESLFFPSIDSIDALIVMGGPMGVHDEEEYDWLKEEKDFIRRFISIKKPMIGICLGSQLIADALGARVYKNKEKEIGWFPITVTEEGRDALFPDLSTPNLTVLHWHGDVLDLPETATLIASSDATPIQSYLVDGHILGLLCHLEMSKESINSILDHCRDELENTSQFIQSESFIRKNAEKFSQQTKKHLFKLLDQFFSSLQK